MSTLVGQFVAAQQQGISNISRSADSLLISTGNGTRARHPISSCDLTFSFFCLDLNALHQDVDTRVGQIRKEGVSYLATVTEASAAESKQLDAHLQQSVSTVGVTQEDTAKLFRCVEKVEKQTQSEHKTLGQTVNQHITSRKRQQIYYSGYFHCKLIRFIQSGRALLCSALRTPRRSSMTRSN
jgi:hypothetical protein